MQGSMNSIVLTVIVLLGNLNTRVDGTPLPAGSDSAPGNAICSEWAGFKPNSIVQQNDFAFSIGAPYDPPVNTARDIRYLLQPGQTVQHVIGTDEQCSGGGCWTCLTSPRSGYSTTGTVETCNHGTEEIRATYGSQGARQLNGNWNKFTFRPGNVGPDGVQLYDILSTPPDQPSYPPFSEELGVVYKDIALLTVTVSPENTSGLLKRYQENAAVIDPTVILVEPCTGGALGSCGGVNGDGCVFTSGPLDLYFWNIKEPLDGQGQYFSNATPL